MDERARSVSASPERRRSSRRMREMLHLAEQAAEGKLEILPGSEWAIHYPVSVGERQVKLQGLLNGTQTADQVAPEITPNALLYDASELESAGLETVSSKIRNLSGYIAHYDYPRFTRFVEGMRGRDIPLSDLDAVYSGTQHTRIQKKLLDAYGHTGREQLRSALRSEADGLLAAPETRSSLQRVLGALKVDWLVEDQRVVTPEQRDALLQTLSGTERDLFRTLKDPYRSYVQSGNETEYHELLKHVQESLPKFDRRPTEGQPSESMQELQEELNEFEDQVTPPGTPGDPAIAPEDEDEYHTPPPGPETAEGAPARPIFEIDPPLAGYYAAGRKSYFDRGTNTWSKRKRLQEYHGGIAADQTWTISGFLTPGLKSLPLPVGYELDASSLHFSDGPVQIHRDQTGCFYLESFGSGPFSIQFAKEATPLASQPISEDLEPLYDGQLSSDTEQTIARLHGSPLQKAEQVRRYLFAHHFYPGGGDLKTAQALQYKLRNGGDPELYLPALDQSEYLECYSANTLFIAMLRKAGVPARLVFGHRVEGAQDGKSVIDESTGHAWAEVWDSSSWRRFDATPPPKPEDKNPEQEGEQQQGAPEADDGGIDAPLSPNQIPGEQADSQQQPTQTQSLNPLEAMAESTHDQVEQAEQSLQQAEEHVREQMQEKQQLEQAIDEAKDFQSLEQLEKQLEQSQLDEDLKEEAQQKLDAKTESLKNELVDQLDQMTDDGFLDEQRREQLRHVIEDGSIEELRRLEQQVERENQLYEEYENLRDEVQPLVKEWAHYFAERLPRQDEITVDEDSQSRHGAFDRRAIQRYRNLLFGRIKNPREIRPSIKPKFLASILVDVSGSMAGEKLRNARKLLIFYSELFSTISQLFGYIRFSIHTFSDGVREMKAFDHDYDSPQRYEFPDGSSSTVKVRLMKEVRVEGGTNMLPAIKAMAEQLRKETEQFPDYASALYFVGDGEDTAGNGPHIREFLQQSDAQQGFGNHMYSALLLGDESQRQTLANIFGDDHTTVVPDLEDLIETSMTAFDKDIEAYLETKT